MCVCVCVALMVDTLFESLLICGCVVLCLRVGCCVFVADGCSLCVCVFVVVSYVCCVFVMFLGCCVCVCVFVAVESAHPCDKISQFVVEQTPL